MDEDGYEQPGVRMSPYVSPHDQNSSSIMFLTNTYPEVDDLKRKLMGQDLDSEGNLVQVTKPLCNVDGIAVITTTISGLVSKHNILTHNDEHNISKSMRSVSDTMVKELMMKGKLWKVDPSFRDVILQATGDTARGVIGRGLKGGDRNFWKGSQQDVRTIVENGSQKRGVFDRIRQWR